MGRGGYNGGSTIFHIWSAGWVGFSRPDLTKSVPKTKFNRKKAKKASAAPAADLAKATPQKPVPNVDIVSHAYSDVNGLDKALDIVLAWASRQTAAKSSIRAVAPAPAPTPSSQEQAAQAALLSVRTPKAISAAEKHLLDKVARQAPKTQNAPSKAERRQIAAAAAAAKIEAAAAGAAAKAAKEQAAAERRTKMRHTLWHKLKAHREAKAVAD